MTTPAANKSIVIRGWILIVLGAFLTIGMGVLTVWFAGAVNDVSGRGGTRWTGSHALTAQVSELFAAVILFGLAAAGGGIYQVRTGRLSKIAFFIMLILIAAMLYVGKGIMDAGPHS